MEAAVRMCSPAKKMEWRMSEQELTTTASSIAGGCLCIRIGDYGCRGGPAASREERCTISTDNDSSFSNSDSNAVCSAGARWCLGSATVCVAYVKQLKSGK